MSQSTGIHCKVVCEDQIRRFHYSGNEFSSLQHQVKQLLGLNREFVLKYRDNENDMITISSTEELSCATEISRKENGGILRLTVFFKESTITCGTPTENGREFGRHGGRRHGGCGFHEKPGCHRDFGGDENHKPWKGRHHGKKNEVPCRNRFEKRKSKLMFKRDMLNSLLSSLDQSKELSPEEERRKQNFQRKIQKIDSILEQHLSDQSMGCHFGKNNFCSKKEEDESEKISFCSKEDEDESEKMKFCSKINDSEIGNCSKNNDFGNYCSRKNNECPKKFHKCERKFEKKERKYGKKKMHKEMKKEYKNSKLSEEEKAEVNSLKNQIKELKPAIWAINDQLKSKKAEARQSFENGQKPLPSFRSDVIRLKNEKRALKDKIAPLRQRIHELKVGSQK